MCIWHRSFTMTSPNYFEGAGFKKKHKRGAGGHVCIGHRSFTMTSPNYVEGAGFKKKHRWASYSS